MLLLVNLNHTGYNIIDFRSCGFKINAVIGPATEAHIPDGICGNGFIELCSKTALGTVIDRCIDRIVIKRLLAYNNTHVILVADLICLYRFLSWK